MSDVAVEWIQILAGTQAPRTKIIGLDRGYSGADRESEHRVGGKSHRDTAFRKGPQSRALYWLIDRRFDGPKIWTVPQESDLCYLMRRLNPWLM